MADFSAKLKGGKSAQRSLSEAIKAQSAFGLPSSEANGGRARSAFATQMTRCHTMKPGYFWGICIFSKDRTSGKVAAVKKLVCYMLIVWLALMAGGANAHTHSADMHSHDVIHAHDHDKSVLANIGESTSLEDASTLDADYSEKLNKVHSCHSHTHHHAAGLPSCHDMLAVADLPSLTPVFSQRFACTALANDVERPKWPVTTPAVVSLST